MLRATALTCSLWRRARSYSASVGLQGPDTAGVCKGLQILSNPTHRTAAAASLGSPPSVSLLVLLARREKTPTHGRSVSRRFFRHATTRYRAAAMT